jgi:glucan biosynthesis protein C
MLCAGGEGRTLCDARRSKVAVSRLGFIDNLRWVMIVLVVSMHAAVTYSHVGSWYFMEDPKPGLPEMIGFATYQTYLQAFFMGFLFLIAGYFVPGAFDRKSRGKFLRDRAVRLGIPTLFYMLVIHPAIVYGMLRDYYGITVSPLQGYLRYLGNPLKVLGSSGPMWFTFALLIFCLVYALLPRAAHNSDAALPTHVQVAALALVMGACSFLVRTVQPLGTNILNMQLCYFSQYVLLFAVGITAWRRNWLMRIPFGFGVRWMAVALIPGTVAWGGFIVWVVGTHTEAKISGGFTWQSAAMCFWEAFFCLGICLGLIVVFREKFDRQGRVARWLSDNCFSVYVFHAPVLIGVTLMMRGYLAPKPLKFLLASAIASVVAWVGSSVLFRRIPVLKRVL